MDLQMEDNRCREYVPMDRERDEKEMDLQAKLEIPAGIDRTMRAWKEQGQGQRERFFAADDETNFA